MLMRLVLVLMFSNAIIKYQVTASFKSEYEIATPVYLRSRFGVPSATCVIIVQHKSAFAGPVFMLLQNISSGH